MTAADYAEVAERHGAVQRAAATFRWTGSWHTVFVTADRVGGGAGRRAVRGRSSAAARALPDGRLRPRGGRSACSCRSRSGCTSASGAATSARTSRPRCATVLSDTHRGRRAARPVPPRPASRSASRSTCRRCSPRCTRSRGSSRSRSRPSSASAQPQTSGIDDGVLDDGPSRDRPPRRRPQLPRARRARPDLRRWHMTAHADRPDLRLLPRHAGGTPASSRTGPGLAEIAYRSGRYGDFRRSMVAGLSGAARPALAGLRTRDADDPTIALARRVGGRLRRAHLLHRAARQRGVPRTATERTSLQELGKLVALPARPGRRRRDVLAFTLERPPAPPPREAARPRLGPAGRARRVVAPGGAARAERARPRRAAADVRDGRAEIEARPEWNALPWLAPTPHLPAWAAWRPGSRRRPQPVPRRRGPVREQRPRTTAGTCGC